MPETIEELAETHDVANIPQIREACKRDSVFGKVHRDIRASMEECLASFIVHAQVEE